jgi:hypothetical protein
MFTRIIHWGPNITTLNRRRAGARYKEHTTLVICGGNAFRPGDPNQGELLYARRFHLYILEQQLQVYQPDVLIPYWDWANEHTLASWVYLPAGVTRGPDPNYPLPTQNDIDTNVLNQSDYVSFTNGLEGYHNTVHMWVGGNTMPNPRSSPHDPMFWLHHANVDRIWAQWQGTHPGVLPPLSGADAWMDPWSWINTNEANDTYDFSYYYA